LPPIDRCAADLGFEHNNNLRTLYYVWTIRIAAVACEDIVLSNNLLEELLMSTPNVKAAARPRQLRSRNWFVLTLVTVLVTTPKVDAWWKLCDLMKGTEDHYKDQEALLGKIKNGAPDVDKAKQKADESTRKMLQKAADTATSMPLTSQDLGKTPTKAAEDALKKAKDELLKKAKDLSGSSSLDPSSEIIQVHPPVLTDRDNLGVLFTQAYADADGDPFLVTDPSGVAIGGYVDFEMIASFNGPPPIDEFKYLYGVPNLVAPNLFDAYVGVAPLPLNLEFFDSGEPATAWLIASFSMTSDGAPAFSASGEINAAARVWIVSGALQIPEPATMELLVAAVAALVWHRRKPQLVS
jgi:hypothetical protein